MRSSADRQSRPHANASSRRHHSRLQRRTRDRPSHCRHSPGPGPEIIVVDNGKHRSDRHESARGGRPSCFPTRPRLRRRLSDRDRSPASETEVVLFLDGDYSDDPAQARELLQALEKHQADLVLGSRTRGGPEPGSLTPQQRFGNWLSTGIIRLIYGHAYTDLGPFRVIRREALSRLDMQDRTYGWTVEMQVKALQQELKGVEIPVSYRPRLGRSKVSGTLSGTVKAGFKILWTIGRLSLRRPLT